MTIFCTAAAFGLAAPPLAAAHRAATKAEKRAMVYKASGRYYYGGTSVAEPRSVPSRCFQADISTVGRGSRWGAWTFSRYAEQPAHAKRCHTGNGVAIEHKVRGRWYVYWEGSDGFPPTRPTRSGSFTLRPVPRAIAKDLLAGLP